MKEWCLGFVFLEGYEKVLLLKKARTMHVGLWNGVGGKVEPGETIEAAMIRECDEEAKLHVADWTYVGELKGNTNGEEWRVAVFGAYCKSFEVEEAHPFLHCKRDVPYKVRLDQLSSFELAPHVQVLAHVARSRVKDPTIKPITMIEVD